MKIVRALVFNLLFYSIQQLIAADDSITFADFQQLAVRSDLKAALEVFKRDHPSPTSKVEVESFEMARVQAAMTLLDRATAFEAQNPQGAHLPQVRTLALDNLWTAFGAIGLPIPQNRIADVEAWTRKRLVDAHQDYRPYMILVRVAGALPQSRQEAALEELGQEKTPEPARSMAKDALRTLKRLGRPLELKFTALDGRIVDLAALNVSGHSKSPT